VYKNLDSIADFEGAVLVAETSMIHRGNRVLGAEHTLNVDLLVLLREVKLIWRLTVVLLILQRSTELRRMGLRA